MPIDIDEKNLKHGVLGLVVALVEIIKDALRLQALRRMEGGSLTEDETNRLGEALMDLDTAIEEMKIEQGITESVKSVRDGLDNIVDELLDKMVGSPRSRVGGREAVGGRQKTVMSGQCSVDRSQKILITDQ